MDDKRFIDYYELMQISPTADHETIQRVYRMLAVRYHPDNPQTGDVERIVLLNQGREILCDPEKRIAYDAERSRQRLKPLSVFSLKEFALGIDGEANRRLGILCLLYHRRRTNPDEPSLSLLELEEMMAFPREHLLFSMWYVSEKKLVRRDEKSNYEITALGIDYVESNLTSHRVLYRLLKAAENGEVRNNDPRTWMADQAAECPQSEAAFS